MTTIIAVYDRHRCLGFCSAKCYNALPPSQRKGRDGGKYDRGDAVCDCICGGANHAMGLTRAIKNRARGVGLTLEAKQCFALEHGYAVDDLVVIDRLSVRDWNKARRLANETFNPTPLPLFECEGFGGNHLSEGRRTARGRGEPWDIQHQGITNPDDPTAPALLNASDADV
jgi:hypothetical protein